MLGVVEVGMVLCSCENWREKLCLRWNQLWALAWGASRRGSLLFANSLAIAPKPLRRAASEASPATPLGSVNVSDNEIAEETSFSSETNARTLHHNSVNFWVWIYNLKPVIVTSRSTTPMGIPVIAAWMNSQSEMPKLCQKCLAAWANTWPKIQQS